MVKNSVQVALALCLLLSLVIAAPAFAAHDSNQITFHALGHTIRWLSIEGTNQKNDKASWFWGDAYYKHWSTGAIALNTDDYWWKGTVTLHFLLDGQQNYSTCVVDNLKIPANGNYTMVTYIPGSNRCTGNAGSAQEWEGSRLALAYFFDKQTGDEVMDAASYLSNGLECVDKLVLALDQPASGVSLIWKCHSLVTNRVENAVKQMGKYIDWKK